MKAREFSRWTFILVDLITAVAACVAQGTSTDPAADLPRVSSLATADASEKAAEKSILTESQATLGPVLPEDIQLPESFLTSSALTDWGAAHSLRFFGWANGGYTWSSTGSGLLNVEPRANRFGDAFILDQSAFVLERTLNEESWSWGFRSEFYMGADAALLHPVNGFGPSDNNRFSTDFRQAYFSFHAPILTDGGS